LQKHFMNRTQIDYKKELLALTKFSRSKFAQSQLFVEFLGWFEDEDNVFLAMEYFPLGTLDKFIGEDLQEEDARVISAQLLEGLKIMHDEGFTHRDLKPQVRQPPQIIIFGTSEYHTYRCRISLLYRARPVGGSKLETSESANAFRMMIQLCTPLLVRRTTWHLKFTTTLKTPIRKVGPTPMPSIFDRSAASYIKSWPSMFHFLNILAIW